MRQYTPIWNEIKLNGKCDVVVHRRLHQRVIHALWKEKDLDLAYKLECAESNPPISAILYSQRDGTVIKFRLKTRSILEHSNMDSV
jgi:hypothetical protein